jgi:hypothetical protein
VPTGGIDSQRGDNESKSINGWNLRNDRNMDRRRIIRRKTGENIIERDI